MVTPIGAGNFTGIAEWRVVATLLAGAYALYTEISLVHSLVLRQKYTVRGIIII